MIKSLIDVQYKMKFGTCSASVLGGGKNSRVTDSFDWNVHLRKLRACSIDSMACDVPFEGAEGNLQRLFEKNQKRFSDLKNDPSKQSNAPKEQW